jgi:hypothetical protein
LPYNLDAKIGNQTRYDLDIIDATISEIFLERAKECLSKTGRDETGFFNAFHPGNNQPGSSSPQPPKMPQESG